MSRSFVFNWQAAGNQTDLGANFDAAACLSTTTTQAVALAKIGVRRLTPRECERLQGWPDDHTRFRRPLRQTNNVWAIAGEPVHQADGPRYKQCGNGVTATVTEWIGRRMIAAADPPPEPPQN